MPKCIQCGENFSLDEVYRIDGNDVAHYTDEYELELNAQNPDYCVGFICESCNMDIEDTDEKVMKMCKEIVSHPFDIAEYGIPCGDTPCVKCPFFVCDCENLLSEDVIGMAKRYIDNHTPYTPKNTKTFKEVIRDIEVGETWVGGNKEISYDGLCINIEQKNSSKNNIFYFDTESLYELKRQQYTFIEAFKAYEDGKIIEHISSGYKFFRDETDEVYKDKYIANGKEYYFTGFDMTMVRDKWYII